MIRNKKINDVEIRVKDKTIFVASDIHFPFQDDYAVSLFVEACEKNQPEIVVLNGDLMDFYKLNMYLLNYYKPTLILHSNLIL